MMRFYLLLAFSELLDIIYEFHTWENEICWMIRRCLLLWWLSGGVT